MLNGQTSNWKNILAGVLQGSILGPLLFLIFINDIPEGIQSNIKIFADDTSIFSVMKDRISASVTLNEDLYLISKWAYSWKMSFNPDPSKQATYLIGTNEILLLCEIFRGCYLYNFNPFVVIRLVASLQLAVLYPQSLFARINFRARGIFFFHAY